MQTDVTIPQPSYRSRYWTGYILVAGNDSVLYRPGEDINDIPQIFGVQTVIIKLVCDITSGSRQINLKYYKKSKLILSMGSEDIIASQTNGLLLSCIQLYSPGSYHGTLWPTEPVNWYGQGWGGLVLDATTDYILVNGDGGAAGAVLGEISWHSRSRPGNEWRPSRGPRSRARPRPPQRLPPTLHSLTPRLDPS